MKRFRYTTALVLISIFSGTLFAAPTISIMTYNNVSEVVRDNNVIGVTATTSSPGATIRQVEFRIGADWANSTALRTDTSAPFEALAWNVAATTNILARVTDSTGATATTTKSISVLSLPNMGRNTKGTLNSVDGPLKNDDSLPVDMIKRIYANVTKTVTSCADWNTKSAGAKAGDLFVVNSMTMTNCDVSISTGGSKSAPIIYLASTPGASIFAGSSSVTVSGNYNVLTGFKFNGVIKPSMLYLPNSSNNRISNFQFINCDATSEKKRIVLLSENAQNNRFDHNLMDNFKSYGFVIDPPALTVTTYTKTANRNRADHNTFKNAKFITTTDRNPIQIGQYPEDLFLQTDTIIDHNIFSGLEIEGVSGKTTGEQYLFNDFSDIDHVALSLRNGDNKVANGNRFKIVKRGLKAWGKNHKIINNLFDQVTEQGIEIPKHNNNEGIPVTKDILVAYNTVINATESITFDYAWPNVGPTATYGPTGCKFISNILMSNNSGTLFRDKSPSDGLPSGTVIEGNLYYGTTPRGILGTSPFVGADPLLDSLPFSGAGTAYSSYKPSATGAASNLGRSGTGVTKDYFDVNRTSTPDIGAVERR